MNNFTKITMCILALAAICTFIVYKYAEGNKKYTQEDISKIIEREAKAKQDYMDSLSFIRSRTELQAEANAAKTERIVALEHGIDSLIRKHAVTKKKVKEFFDTTGMQIVSVPPEYVDECEGCFSRLQTYKNENVFLRFERDAYDTLMRNQIDIHSNRIVELEYAKKQQDTVTEFYKKKAEGTRKLKISAMAMASSVFSPKGAGPGLIYEDKKYNEYGGHVVFTSAGNMYFIHAAKTISFRRKKNKSW